MAEGSTRRRVLARTVAASTLAGVTGGLAGCLQETPRRTSRAILITNETDAAFTVTLRVYALPAGALGADTTDPSGTADATVSDTGGVDGTPTADEMPTADGRPTATSGSVPSTEGSPTSTALEPPTRELEQVLLRRADTPPGEGFGVGGDALPAGDLRVRVTTTDGQSNAYDWARLDERSTLDVRVEPNAVRFTEID